MKKGLLYLAAGIALTALIITYGASLVVESDDGRDLDKLVAGYSLRMTGLPFIVGIEKGFFSDEGIMVESKTLSGGTRITEACLVGSIDVGSSSDTPVISAASRGGKITVVATSLYSGGKDRLMVSTRLNVSSLPDLRGRRIALEIGSVNHKDFLLLIEGSNLSENDFEIINLRLTESMLALETGDADAIITTEPYATISEFEGFGRELVNFRDIDVAPNSIIMRNGLLEEDPALAIRFLKAWIRSIDYIKTHEQEAKMMMSLASGTDFDIIDSAMGRMIYEPNVTDDIKAAFIDDAGFLLSQCKIDDLPDFEKLIDTSYLEEAYRHL